jgi:hypothetical protein
VAKGRRANAETQRRSRRKLVTQRIQRAEHRVHRIRRKKITQRH